MFEARHHVKPKEDRRFLGIMMVLVAIVLFTGIDTSAKWLVLNGIPPSVVVFMRFAMHLALIVAITVPLQGMALLRTGNLKLEIVRAITLLIATVLNFIAIQFLPLTVTGAILFSMPLFLTAMSGPLLGEHVGWRRWFAVIVGFAGVLVIIRPGGESLHWSAVLLLGSPISFALYSVASRRLAGIDSAYTQQIYSALLPALCALPVAAVDWTWPTASATWFAFFAMGLFGGSGHLLLTMAHRVAPASILAPFLYPQIVLMSLSSWIVFSQPPDLPVYVGATIVVGSSLYIWLRERQLGTAG